MNNIQRRLVGSCVLVGVAFGIAGCVPQESPPVAAVPMIQTRPLTPAEKVILARLLVATLKDPDSAKFRWGGFPTIVADGPMIYCGQFNARNGYGGYNGFRPFAADVTMSRGQIVAASMADSEAIGEYGVLSRCRDAGLNPLTAE